MTDASKKPQTPPEPADRRLFRRIATRIEGRIVYAGVDAECLIHEMSATGAVVEVLPLPALGTSVALDAPGVGFARGRAVRYPSDCLVSIELDVPPTRRDRLTDKLILAAFRFPPITESHDR
jgi:hypothetical protein